MSPEQKQLLRDALLTGLVDALPFSLPLATLRGIAKAAGFEMDALPLTAQLEYLTGKALVEVSRSDLSAGVQRWKATAAAVEYCEANHLV